MIVICEPQCKGMSHEQVNSGFIYGLRLAYPEEKILFFADDTHFQTIKNIWENNNISVDNLEHIPISFDAGRSYSIGGIIKYFFLFKNTFSRILSLDTNKIFFLSNNPIILYVIKKLKQRDKYKNIHCTFVLHGDLEDIANVKYKEPHVPVIKNNGVVTLNVKEIIVKLYKHRDKIMPLVVNWMYSKYSLVFKKLFGVKKMLLWQHSDHYKYIVLSPHILKNAKEHINTDYLNFHIIIMPVIFAKPGLQADNEYIKFAVFGYGDSVQMQRMLPLLTEKKIAKPYEIKIISMDCRGTEGFPNVNCISRGKVLAREDMENSLHDIDMFINLYDSTRHKFGCSGSIFEAFSYLKPVLHLSNDGYNYFNKPEKPIGYRCENLDEYVEKMRDMIENYPSYKSKLAIFRNNMLEYRDEYAIENNLLELKRSFIFD